MSQIASNSVAAQAGGMAGRAAPMQRRQSDHVKTCQVGYLPNEAKAAMLTARPAGDVLVRRASDDGVVVRAVPGGPVSDADSGDTVYAVDFSPLADPGRYYLEVPGVGAGHEFEIGACVFRRALRLSTRMFTGQRCGTAVSLAPDFPEYAHGCCHAGPAEFHPSSGRRGTCRCPAGWHDAGDYGRYTVNACVSTGTLLWAYELNEASLRPLRLDLPESGNGLPDFLAEIRWNLQWLLSMQDAADGGVWHKETSVDFPGFVMPEHDAAPPQIIGSGEAPYKTTPATADFAAVCAAAGRIYRAYDGVFADTCLAAAARAWDWLEAHPAAPFLRNPPGITTGGYPDRAPEDELLWAAAELFRSTGERRYNDFFLALQHRWQPAVAGERPQSWSDVANLAMYCYALAGRRAGDLRVVDRIRADSVLAADAIAGRIARHAYRVPLLAADYVWGSNGVVANYAMMLLLTHRWHPRPAYLNAALDCLHYLFGRNTFNTSFVTHVGQRWPRHPHHRPSGADGVREPWPGMLVGGPNASSGSPPARQWFDVQESFTTNEIAINWNAPLVFLLSEMLPA